MGGDLTTMGMSVLQSDDRLQDLKVHEVNLPSSPPMTPTKPVRFRSPRSKRSSKLADPKLSSGRKVSSADKENRSVIRFPAKPIVMEQVTILKRGENLKHAVDGRSDGGDKLAHCSTSRIGPEPEILPKQNRFANPKPVYAGPGFSSSPAPSSVPFPALFLNRDRTAEVTRGLRGLLHLDDLP